MKKYYFFGILKVTEERSQIRSWIRIQIYLSEVWNLGSGSALRKSYTVKKDTIRIEGKV
jgi:hypothetical protein